MDQRENIGIIAIETYSPNTYVEASELEVFDGASSGKYVKGFGQLQIGVTGDREDVNSLALTAVSRLLEKYQVSPARIGHLEVGTETIIDTAKSTKTYLMNLFEDNYNVEGVTTVNACYGGTQALLNTVAWVESSAWDGRLGLVVAVDIPISPKTASRLMGSAGAVAMLIGPDAPLVMCPVRVSYFNHAYDFYNPIGNAGIPMVDGAHSIDCYLTALERCYTELKRRRGVRSVEQLSEYYCFHSPFPRMSYKAFTALVYFDQYHLHRLTPEESEREPQFDPKRMREIAHNKWLKANEPSCRLIQRVGNAYTATLYVNLQSLIVHVEDLPVFSSQNRYVTMFSYGSGLSATMYQLYVRPDAGSALTRMRTLADLSLVQRVKVTPEEYIRRRAGLVRGVLMRDCTPTDPVEELRDGTFYLVKVDANFRRYYARKATPKL